MQIPPSSVLASWPTPNYENPSTRGNALLVVLILFSILMAAAAGGRFYSRIYLSNWFGLDDGAMLLALIFAIGMNASVILANQKYGWDRHVWDLEWNMFQRAGIVAFAAKLLFVAAATFTRISLICFYHRLVRDSGISWFRIVLHLAMAFVILLGICFACVGIWLCVPIEAYWRFPPLDNFKCLDEGTTTLVVGILNSVADLLTTVLPIPLVIRLKMPMRLRIGVCFLLGLGIVVTAAGAIRTYFIWVAFESYDVTWLSYPLWICAAIEIDLAVICACAPALKPLLQRSVSHATVTFRSRMNSLRSSRRSENALSGSSEEQKSSGASQAKDTISTCCFKNMRAHLLWDKRDESIDLHLNPETLEKPSVTFISSSGEDVTEPSSEQTRPGLPARKPTLEIMKRQSVDQQISYIDPTEQCTERREEFDRHPW